MLQYSLVNQGKKKTCFKDLANHQSKTQLEHIEKCLNGHMKENKHHASTTDIQI
jgi:hypothetical protein